MAPRHIHMFALLLAGSWTLGCGGGETPPSETPQAPAAKPAAKVEAKPADKKADEAGDEQVEEEAKPAEPEVYKPDRPPRDILTQEDTAFEFNFSASEIGIKTSDRCETEAGSDMKARNECKKKVQDKVGLTVMRFVEKQGIWWWVTYSRRGQQLTAIHRIAITWGEQTDNTVELLPQGKDKGLAPLSPVPRSVVVTIPSSYAIELNDKQWGKMQYSIKFGMFPKGK